MLKNSLNIFLFYFFAASCIFQSTADAMLEKGQPTSQTKPEINKALWATGWAVATIVATAGTLYSHQWFYHRVKAYPHKNDNNPSSTHQRTQALTGPARAANLQLATAMQHASQLPAPLLTAHTPRLTPIALTPAVTAVAEPITLQSPLSNSAQSRSSSPSTSPRLSGQAVYDYPPLVSAAASAAQPTVAIANNGAQLAIMPLSAQTLAEMHRADKLPPFKIFVADPKYGKILEENRSSECVDALSHMYTPVSFITIEGFSDCSYKLVSYGSYKVWELAYCVTSSGHSVTGKEIEEVMKKYLEERDRKRKADQASVSAAAAAAASAALRSAINEDPPAPVYRIINSNEEKPTENALSLDEGIRYGFPGNPKDRQTIVLDDRRSGLQSCTTFEWNELQNQWIHIPYYGLLVHSCKQDSDSDYD